MIPGVYNYGSSLKGDTISAKLITATRTIDSITTPIDLTNYSLKMDIVLGALRKTLLIGDGITITDAENGVFRIDSFILTHSGTWKYDIQFTYNGDVETYIKGTINILEDVTQ